MEEHIEHRVPAALRPYVRSMTGYRLGGFRPGRHLGLPGGTLTMVLDLAEGLTLSTTGRPERRRFSASVAGLHTRAVTIHHDGHQHGIQVELTPAGARALLGVPAGALVHDVLPLEDVLGTRATYLQEQVREAPGWSGLDVLCRAFLDRLPADPATDAADRVWRRIVTSGGRVTVAGLAAETGWSVRRLNGLVSAELGLGPKTAARLARFERSRHAMGTGHSIAAIATACGYADQAHLAREWRDFTGLSPSRWLRREEFVPADAGKDAPAT